MSAPEPRENPTLIGNAPAEVAITEAMAGNRLHHAWLISGPEGVGKATLAFRFARALLAGSASLDLPASHPVFRRVAAGSHADLLTVEREWDDKKKRMKKTISAESAREIAPFLHLTPAEGGWRAVIVDGAEDLNPQSANALLKVLEEPPARAVLLLVCSAPGRLLPTIRSRCRRLTLEALAEPEMRRVLGHFLPQMPLADQDRLIGLAEGSPGRALRLAGEGGLQTAGLVAEIVAALPEVSLLRGYEIADKLRDEVAFETFFGLLRGTLAAAVTAQLRGRATPEQARLAAMRAPGAWGEIWDGLTRLQNETDWFNLDRRQAVMTGLALLRGA